MLSTGKYNVHESDSNYSEIPVLFSLLKEKDGRDFPSAILERNGLMSKNNLTILPHIKVEIKPFKV